MAALQKDIMHLLKKNHPSRIFLGVLGVFSIFILLFVFGVVRDGKFATQVSVPQPERPKVTTTLAPAESRREGLLPAEGDVLEASFHLSGGKTLKATRLVIKNGYPPASITQEGGLTAQLLDVRGTIVFQTQFVRPDVIYDPPPLGPETAVYGTPSLPEVDFAITLPVVTGATTLRILDSDGVILGTVSLQNLQKEWHEPKFRTRPPKTKPQQSGLLSQDVLAGESASYLDITFIGDKYTDFDNFHYDVNRFSDYLLTFEPFTSRATQILFHYIDNTSDLQCKHSDPPLSRLILCNGAAVAQAVNNAAAPHDGIVVIVNDQGYGGSGGSIAVAYNGSMGHRVFVHEFGHSLGNLLDEYVLFSSNGSVSESCKMNCCMSTACTDWQKIRASCVAGCNHPNWYRSSEHSIMQSVSYEYFNTVSRNILDTAISTYAPLPSSDLIPQKLQSSIAFPQEGNFLIFSGVVQNKEEAVPSSLARFCIDNPGCRTSAIGRLGPSDVDVPPLTANVSSAPLIPYATWKAIGGSHTINFCVNTGSPPITEISTSNNCISQTFTVTSSPNPDFDSDADAFPDNVEIYIGTNRMKKCPATAVANDEAIDSWPPDFDDSRTVDISDVNLLKPVFNSRLGDSIYKPRYDLNADGIIDIQDIGTLKQFFNMRCVP